MKLSLKHAVQALLTPDYDQQALVQLGRFGLGYVAWTSSAMRPAGLRLVVNELLINRRKSGIEFGAGVSTLFLAKAFEQLCGRLVVVEHDVVWLEKVEADLKRCGISGDTCTFVHAPLTKRKEPKQGGMWYDWDVLEERTARITFDLSLVDGPISSLGNEAVRDPACEFLKHRLRGSYALFVDDIDRPKDLELAHSWALALQGQITVYAAHGAVAVIRPPGDRCYNIC